MIEHNNGRYWLELIRKLPLDNLKTPLRIMNVCGGHERTLSASGIRSLLPSSINLIPGPGCPVCVCPEETIDFAITLSTLNDVILVSFGDMLRVPANNGNHHTNTLIQSRSLGNAVIAVASPIEVLSIANNNPNKTVIFFVAGFETTLAPIVALLDQDVPDNLKLLISARKTWPIVQLLLSSSNNNLDALIAPGHVASVMGGAEWDFIVKQFNLPCAIAGFNESSILAAIYSVCRQSIEKKYFLDNCYPTIVSNVGNKKVQFLFEKYFSITTSKWRGIGDVKDSGYTLKERYNHINAEFIFLDLWEQAKGKAKQSARHMPQGCDCDQIVLGKIMPDECRLFNKACTPTKPIGPCMVSDEGACHIWWSTNLSKKNKSRDKVLSFS